MPSEAQDLTSLHTRDQPVTDGHPPAKLNELLERTDFDDLIK